MSPHPAPRPACLTRPVSPLAGSLISSRIGRCAALCQAALVTLTALASAPLAARCLDEESLLAFTGSHTAPVAAAAAPEPRLQLQQMVREALARSNAVGAAALLAERAVLGDEAARRRLLEEVYRPLLAAGGEVLTLLRGAGAGDTVMDALLGHLAGAYPALEVVVLDGGQAVPVVAMAVE